MHDLNSLKIFLEVVNAGGYTAAHRKTGQSRATLSRHVTELETALGARLIERSTRSFKLTEQGRILHDRSLDIFAQLDDAVAMVENLQREPSGVVRAAIPPSLMQLHLGDEVMRYMQIHTQVRMELEISNRQVDLQNEDVDFVIRARSQMDYPQHFVPVVLGTMPLRLVVHPRWATAIKGSLHETLEHAPVIAWKTSNTQPSWQLIAQDGLPVEVPLRPRLLVNDLATLRQAALQGIGMAIIPEIYVRNAIDQGELIEVALDLQAPASIIHAVHLGRKGMRPAVRHLLDWLKDVTQHLR
ncbi:LysR substrate-binding domain-containing protein [Diaphorobacter aerolatus]|uniref:LysR family transcriptional regulator n=1 Tax=Diaphorobacter aerolatus TaxID=1288495 RepID=A0A7H0GLQ9_9BURK|nr:LysR substrate-binding domain-containing protein [Diaphorobacter aerolatus]QNP49225.1 LysR family transcriptional regulator [Diaphorobacter aerolatus]